MEFSFTNALAHYLFFFFLLKKKTTTKKNTLLLRTIMLSKFVVSSLGCFMREDAIFQTAISPSEKILHNLIWLPNYIILNLKLEDTG